MIGLNQINGNTTLLHELIEWQLKAISQINIDYKISNLSDGSRNWSRNRSYDSFFSCNKVVIAWIRN